ncbi:MAG: prephenate dehydratase [Lachnospiraceae bacterium]|nr:prephenate dehydratase [Lachnospiraceae bacterium]
MDVKELRNETDRVNQKLADQVRARMELAGPASEYDRMAAEEILAETEALARRKEFTLTPEQADDEHGFTSVPELAVRGVRVVFQGVEGAYSHQATRLFFGRDADMHCVPTFEGAVEEIDRGEAEYAVLPIENTTGGAVGDVLDLQMKYSCYTVAELDLPIRHVLLGLPDARLEEIDTVYSHPQGLLQCSDFLEKHREWGRIPMNNTAASAKRLVADGDPRHAAIASEMAGELYGLKVLAENIANQTTGNTTRFIIATGKKIYRQDAGKIRICFECRHATGVLYRLLSNFAFNGLNMTKIESRPIPGRNWEYRFFIDFEGNLDEPRVKTALAGIRREASLCKVLGNF